MIRQYPSVYLLVFVIAGILAADITHLQAWMFLLPGLISLIVAALALSRGRQVASMVLLAATLFCFAGFHFALRLYDVGPTHVSRMIQDGERYHLFGRVSDWPRLKTNRTEVTVALDSIGTEDNRPAYGAILLRISDTTTALQRGDRLEFSGRIYTIKGGPQPGQLNYRRYLDLKGIHGMVYLPTLLDVRIDRGSRFGLFRVVDRVRDAIRNSFYRNLSPTSAALAAGFLIGETRHIPVEIYRRFRDTGTLHVLAVSGANVALVVLAISFLLRPFGLSSGRRAGLLLAVILVFALLSYGEPSVIRASIMAALVIMAGLLQRRYDLNNIIAATALIILLVEPTHLFNIGFQLSFATAWGLIFLTPRIGRIFRRYHQRSWYRWLVFPLIISVVAQACSMPLIALHFGRVPVISVAANLVIVPLVSIAVVGVIILLLADLVLPLLGMFVGSLLNQWLELIVFLLSGLGGEHIPVVSAASIPPLSVAGAYLVMVLLVLSLHMQKVRRVTVFVVLVLVNLVLGSSVFSSLARTRSPALFLVSIPGGVAGIYRSTEGQAADLILTDAVSTDYDLGERILAPLLRGLGIDQLNSIVIPLADYGAFDDILNLAHSFAASAVYVPNRLEQSVAEIMRQLDTSRADLRTVTFGDRAAGHLGPGLYPDGNGTVLRLDSAVVLLCSQAGREQLTLLAQLGRFDRYFCGRVAPKIRDSLDLAGWPGIEQIRGGLVARIAGGATVPDKVLDLTEAAGATLLLADDLKLRPGIRP